MQIIHFPNWGQIATLNANHEKFFETVSVVFPDGCVFNPDCGYDDEHVELRKDPVQFRLKSSYFMEKLILLITREIIREILKGFGTG